MKGLLNEARVKNGQDGMPHCSQPLLILAYNQKQMDELELIRWLDVLVQTGMIRRWQLMLWSGDAPVFYVIDGRIYRREAAVRLVRHFRDAQCRLIGLSCGAKNQATCRLTAA